MNIFLLDFILEKEKKRDWERGSWCKRQTRWQRVFLANKKRKCGWQRGRCWSFDVNDDKLFSSRFGGIRRWSWVCDGFWCFDVLLELSLLDFHGFSHMQKDRRVKRCFRWVSPWVLCFLAVILLGVCYGLFDTWVFGQRSRQEENSKVFD